MNTEIATVNAQLSRFTSVAFDFSDDFDGDAVTSTSFLARAPIAWAMATADELAAEIDAAIDSILA